MKNPRKYIKFNYPSNVSGGKTLLTGIRGVKNNPGLVYISGFYQYPDDNIVAFVYKGNIYDKGDWYVLEYPSTPIKTVVATNLYGPNNGIKKKHIQVVGNYTTEQTGLSTIGCLYEGTLNGDGKWTTLIPTSDVTVLNTIAHSTMGGLVVGNYDTHLIQGKAFLYDIKRKKYYDIIKPKSKSITAYGIWHNGGNSYTICGGFSNVDKLAGLDSGYVVDYNRKTHKFSNWKRYYYGNDRNNSIITHFDGITKGKNGYNLTGDWLGIDQNEKLAFFVTIKRKKNGKFSKGRWSTISYSKQSITSGNSVYKHNVIGVYTYPGLDGVNGYMSFIKKN